MNKRIQLSAPPRHQKGVALVISMVLLVVCLLLGVSSMQSSLLDERLAGNHREAVLARMAAEAGIAAVVNDSIPSTGPGDWESLLSLTSFSSGSDEDSKASYIVDYKKENSYVFLKSTGFYGLDDRVAESTIIAKYRAAGGSVFDAAVVGCEGITVSGGSRIGSYDSTSPGKDWNENKPGKNAGLKTLGGDADIVLGDNAKIYGNVASNGSIIFGKKNQGSSSEVFGDVVAGDDVEINGDSSVNGSVAAAGSVKLSGSGEVSGNLSANRDVNFEKDSSFVGGNVYAGGKVKAKKGNAESHVGGAILENSSPENTNSPVDGECDALNIKDAMRKFNDVNNSGPLTIKEPYIDWVITPSDISYFNQAYNVERRQSASSRKMEIVEVNGREMSMLKTGDFNLANTSLTISGGDVAIFVDGDLNLGTGGGRGLVIEKGSTLTFFVTGSTKIASTIKMNAENSVNSKGHAVFSIYSSKEDKKKETGVVIDGGSNVVANVYAPLANVSVNSGGGVFGALRGKTLEIEGDGTIAYDEALGMMDSSGGGESGSGPEFVSWSEPIN